MICPVRFCIASLWVLCVLWGLCVKERESSIAGEPSVSAHVIGFLFFISASISAISRGAVLMRSTPWPVMM